MAASAIGHSAHSSGDQNPFVPSVFGFAEFSVPAVLDQRASQSPGQVMISIDGAQVTFEVMRDLSCAAANILTDLGVQRGDTVALFTPTSPEWLYFWLGAARIGAISAAVNTAHKGEFLAHALRLSRAKVVITDTERRPRVDEVRADVPGLDSVLITGDSLSSALAAASSRPPDIAPCAPDEVGALFFTSGTTGPSKAVVLTWHYLFSMAAAVASAWQFGPDDVLWSAMPLFHVSAAPIALAPLLFGGSTVLSPAFHPTRVLDEIRDCGATGFAGAGAMVSMLWNLPADPRDNDNPLRFISAAPIASDLYRRVEQRYGVRVVTMYGMTEAFPIAFKAAAEEGVPGTAGRINPAFDARVVDDAGRPAAIGAVGEITCRAMFPHVMSEGYVAAADGHEILIDRHPEWFRTGDLGSLDAHGNLTYVDRIKDSLRRRGENVSSVEVETAVVRHPAVAEAAAVGVPSELGEDDILVVVTLLPDAALDYVELLDFCSARMPYFCVPRYLEVLDEMPKNAVGRVRKDLLRSRGVVASTWDREAQGYIVSR
jgi:carnitine-CoA ligase